MSYIGMSPSRMKDANVTPYGVQVRALTRCDKSHGMHILLYHKDLWTAKSNLPQILDRDCEMQSHQSRGKSEKKASHKNVTLESAHPFDL